MSTFHGGWVAVSALVVCVVVMLSQRRRRCTNIKITLDQRIVFAGYWRFFF